MAGEEDAETRWRAARQGAGETPISFSGGPYLCAGIRTDCGDADKARLRGPAPSHPGWGHLLSFFLLSRDQKHNRNKRMNFFFNQPEDKCDYLTI